jgi:hypothetical protein
LLVVLVLNHLLAVEAEQEDIGQLLISLFRHQQITQLL